MDTMNIIYVTPVYLIKIDDFNFCLISHIQAEILKVTETSNIIK